MKAVTKEKLKRFLGSNLGITIMVIVIIGILAIGGCISRHVKNYDTDSEWQATEKNTSPQVVPLKKTESSPVAHETSEPLEKNSVTQSLSDSKQMHHIKDRLDEVTAQMKAMNQRLMVITQALEQYPKHNAVIKKYRVLGTHLDQETNQFVADIQYNGELNSYTAGQRFGQYSVESVTSTGVKIR